MEAADRHAFSVEAALVFCGDVVLRQVGVEVEGDVLQPPAAFASMASMMISGTTSMPRKFSSG